MPSIRGYFCPERWHRRSQSRQPGRHRALSGSRGARPVWAEPGQCLSQGMVIIEPCISQSSPSPVCAAPLCGLAGQMLLSASRAVQVSLDTFTAHQHSWEPPSYLSLFRPPYLNSAAAGGAFFDSWSRKLCFQKKFVHFSCPQYCCSLGLCSLILKEPCKCFFRQQTEAQTSQLLVQGHRGRCESSQSVAVLYRAASLWQKVCSARWLHSNTQAERVCSAGLLERGFTQMPSSGQDVLQIQSRVPFQRGGGEGVRVGAELCCLLDLLCLPGKGLQVTPESVRALIVQGLYQALSRAFPINWN